jgi:beta-glucanase (GH16 family)
MMFSLILKRLFLVFSFILSSTILVQSQNHHEILPDLDGQWETIPELSDEFNGDYLDTTKWLPNNPGWLGRKPAYFSKDNVILENGMLSLVAKTEELEDLPEGYHTFTTAAVQSKTRIQYGYFEMRCQAMDSRCSSAFWFYAIDPDIWTEIDVFEICGKHPDKEWEHKIFATTHVFKTPEDGENHWSDHEVWIAPFRLADEFITVGLEWNEKVIRWYVNGEVIRTRENTHWHQPLTMNFDSETMPEWWGLPDPKDPAGYFMIDYIRSWKKLE